MSAIRERAIRAQPPEQGAAAWCERERERINTALQAAHAMQAAPGWYDFVDYFLQRIERHWPDVKESVVRNTWREERRLTVDEFEWDNPPEQRQPTCLEDLCCDECGHFDPPLGGIGAKAVCESCWETIGYEQQASLQGFC